MNPRVSVIIPIYNSEKYLHRCFDSILKNEYDNLEIIPINDGSKDNSQSIIDEYAKKYPKIFFPIIQENQGIGVTRNNAMEKVTGDYILFIDNDDYIDSDYIQTHINQVLENDYDMVLSGYRRVTDEKTQFSVTLKDGYPWTKFISIAPWARLYKTSFLKDNDIKFLKTPIGEDVYFNLQANTLTDKIKIIDYIGYNWYQNSISVTNTITKKIKGINILNLLDTHFGVLEEKGCINNNEEILTVYFVLLITQFLQWISKGSSYKEVSKYYDDMFQWLDTHFPKYKKVHYWKLSKGDRLKIRLILLTITTCNKIHLGKLIVFLYGKI